MKSVNAEYLLSAAATLAPPRAASLRGMLEFLAPKITAHPLAEIRERWLAEPPPGDDAAAWRALVAEDLGPILNSTNSLAASLESWQDPMAALNVAAARICQQLATLGIEVPAPHLERCDRFPAAYDHPSLSMVSLDASDVGPGDYKPGVLVLARRMAPYWSELALGHVLVHHALGVRSPELLGRGFEEGLCEVLGGLYAAPAACGAQPIDAAFRALRSTSGLNPHRESLMGWARGAALLHRRRGLAHLAQIVRSGRGAVKQSEAALWQALPMATDDADTTGDSTDQALRSRLDCLFSAPTRPLTVGPLAFYLTRALRAGGSVGDAARTLGVPHEAARSAARELHHGAFVALINPQGQVLVDDLELVLGCGALRYALPRD